MGKQQVNVDVDLSENSHSATHVLSGWVSKIEGFQRTYGLEPTRTAILADLKEHVGHGISERKFKFYEDLILKAKKPEDLFTVVCNSYLCGAGLTMR